MGKEIAEATRAKSHIQKIWKPESIQEAIKLKNQLQEESTYIAGGTLLQLQREQGTPLPPNLIRLDQIPKLNQIKHDQDILHVGAYVSLAECQMNSDILETAPLLAEAVKEVASPAVRNRGTLGGNISYKVGDTIPALLALDVDISWVSGEQLYTTNLWDYIQHATDLNAVITTLHIKKQASRKKQLQFYQKVGRRESFIPSLVTASVYCDWNDRKEIEHIRLAVAGGTSAPVRLESCEAFLFNKKLTEDDFDELYDMILTEYQPTSDPFVTKQYKQQVAANLIVSELMRYVDE